MSTQHTPGPWEINEDGIIVGGNERIAEPIFDSTSEDVLNRHNANIALILAVPDLYAALHDLLEQVAVSGYASQFVTDDARAAIAKVEGQ